ncbi:hypothetical protein [Nonomuraea typhae]|uniref:Calcium-binding protein n=1 Tax=Nonomuraea typhae TaxID=2603600 RepID=A0ABW7ZC88_9ACTN
MKTKHAILTGVLLTMPLVALTAGPAMAFTNVSASSGQLSVNSADAADNISINLEGGFLVVRNSADTLLAGSAVCSKVDDHTVRCPSAGITNILVNSQGGSDTVRNNTSLRLRAFLGPGRDTFFGGSAQDFVSGNADNDVLNGNGGADILLGNEGGSDQAFGGPGSDFCEAETEGSCEE